MLHFLEIARWEITAFPRAYQKFKFLKNNPKIYWRRGHGPLVLWDLYQGAREA